MSQGLRGTIREITPNNVLVDICGVSFVFNIEPSQETSSISWSALERLPDREWTRNLRLVSLRARIPWTNPSLLLPIKIGQNLSYHEFKITANCPSVLGRDYINGNPAFKRDYIDSSPATSSRRLQRS